MIIEGLIFLTEPFKTNLFCFLIYILSGLLINKVLVDKLYQTMARKPKEHFLTIETIKNKKLAKNKTFIASLFTFWGIVKKTSSFYYLATFLILLVLLTCFHFYLLKRNLFSFFFRYSLPNYSRNQPNNRQG